MATATKNYKPMTDSERDAYRADRRLKLQAAELEAQRLEREHEARLAKISDETVNVTIKELSQYDRDRLTKWAKTKMRAAGYSSIRDDSEKLAATRREIMRELLSVEMTMGDIEEE